MMEHRMPKLKTNSGAKKRFKITKSGKIKRSNAFKNHKLEGKTMKRKRQLRKSSIASSSEEKKIKRMITKKGEKTAIGRHKIHNPIIILETIKVKILSCCLK